MRHEELFTLDGKKAVSGDVVVAAVVALNRLLSANGTTNVWVLDPFWFAKATATAQTGALHPADTMIRRVWFTCPIV